MPERHKYEYSVNLRAESAAAKVVRMVGKNKRTLEIGAGPGSITRLLKEHGGCQITAIELDETAIRKLKPFCEKVYQCDLNVPSWVSQVSERGKFDAIVAADVLEHLYEPWATLSLMRNILTDQGHVVVSLPHIGHNAVVASLLNGNFEYQEWGLLDRTHIRFFGIRNIQKLFQQAGLKIIEAEFVVKKPEETEFASQWRKLRPETRKELNKNNYGNVYQVVVKAVPASASEKALNLASIQVPGADTFHEFSLVQILKRLVRRYLSIKMRSRMANVLVRLGMDIGKHN